MKPLIGSYSSSFESTKTIAVGFLLQLRGRTRKDGSDFEEIYDEYLKCEDFNYS